MGIISQLCLTTDAQPLQFTQRTVYRVPTITKQGTSMRLILYLGKGGVGKTTSSAATAVHA
ncbi:MAG TPA: ArsA-related P-loop ATPase, partial [Roseiflexaceae bacterium]|nr:ArsA-related P-loop ATPase [Roseiflexaceae bacterium]